MQFSILVSVEGSATFTVDADTEEEATEIAQAMIDDGEWKPDGLDRPDFMICDVKVVGV